MFHKHRIPLSAGCKPRPAFFLAFPVTGPSFCLPKNNLVKNPPGCYSFPRPTCPYYLINVRTEHCTSNSNRHSMSRIADQSGILTGYSSSTSYSFFMSAHFHTVPGRRFLSFKPNAQNPYKVVQAQGSLATFLRCILVTRFSGIQCNVL